MDVPLSGKLLQPGLPEKSLEVVAADRNLHLLRLLVVNTLVVTLFALDQLLIGNEILRTSSKTLTATVVVAAVARTKRRM